MKLIIDIPEERYKDIKRIASVQLEMRIDTAEQIIANGTPFDSVIENIKAEIKQWYWQVDKQALAKDPCVVDAMVDLFIRTLDKHISGKENE